MASVRFDLQARSRGFLRRGLVLSGAIHLVLLYAFLHLPGSGKDVLIRSYDRATDIFRQPVTIPLVPLPPVNSGAPPAAAKTGTVVPVDPTVLRMPVEFKGIGVYEAPGGSGPTTTEAGIPRESGVPAGDPDPNRVFFITDVDVPPLAIEAPKPPYPDMAKDAGITGHVVAEVLVRADGGVAQVRVKSGNKLLADSVQETLYRWRFRPAMAHGHAVAVWVEIPVNFTL